MKLFAGILLILAALAALVSAADDATNIKFCKKNGGKKVLQAIDKFCTRTDGKPILVPSKYATEGVKHKGTKVYIKGSCRPPQWLPKKWCLAHFHEACGSQLFQGTGGLAAGSKAGKAQCQTFLIKG